MTDLKAAVIDFQQALLKRRVASRFAERHGMEHPSDDARKQYLKDHPNADPKNHTVKKTDGGGSGGSSAQTAAGPVTSQMTSLVKKIDSIDAGATGKELERHVKEISSIGLKLEKQLEKLDGKIDDKKLNRAIEHAQSLSGYTEKLRDAAGDPAKVDRLLGDIQSELKDAMKLLR